MRQVNRGSSWAGARPVNSKSALRSFVGESMTMRKPQGFYDLDGDVANLVSIRS